MLKKLIPASVAVVLAANLLSGFQKGDPDKGKELFEQCGVCHNADSEEKKMGPGLKGLFKKAKLNNGKKPTEETVRGVINEGGNGMPAYKEILSDEEKNHVIAYLKTL
ncbi:MAG: c-type cytochrome [Acidobacteria bacterium]|nr:c-type cytochrome [Acidobacteriota bacterium]